MITRTMTDEQLCKLLANAYEIGWSDYELVYDSFNKNEWKDAIMKMKRDKFIEQLKKSLETK